MTTAEKKCHFLNIPLSYSEDFAFLKMLVMRFSENEHIRQMSTKHREGNVKGI